MLQQTEEEEESGLSTGFQLGIATFFVGLPIIGMGLEALGWGEIGLVAAGLTAGGLGLGTKLVIDKRNKEDEQPGNPPPGVRISEAFVQAMGIDRLQNADWGALLRPVGAPAPLPVIAAPKEATEAEKAEAETKPLPAEEVDSFFPHTSDDARLTWGVMTKFNKRFDPPVNKVLGAGAVYSGTQGAGKSNLIGLTVTSAARCKMSVLVVDYKNEFYPLRDILPTCILAGHPDHAEKAGPPYYPLTKENAAEFAADIMENGYQAIFIMNSYRDIDEMAETLAEVLHALMDWAFSLEDESDRLPCLVVTDEAHNFVPENVNLSGLPLDPKNFKLLKKAYARMANTGRSLGFTLVMATQRIANIAKWSIANLHIKVIMKQDELNDLARCEEYIGKGRQEELLNLEAGQGFVLGLTKSPMLVQFDVQEARHVSETPKIERAHKRFKQAEQPRFSRVLARRIPGTDKYQPVKHTGPLASDVRPLRRGTEPTHNDFDTRMRAQDNDLSQAQNEAETQDDTRTDNEHKNDMRQPVEPTHTAQNDATTKYRLTDEQIKMFCALYPNIIKNKDDALRKVGANTLYRAHANEIIQRYNLKANRR